MERGAPSASHLERRRAERRRLLKMFGLSAVGSAVDYLTVYALAIAAAWPTPVAAVSGLVLGASVTFTLNRLLVFGGAGSLSSQLLRFILVLAVLLSLDATAVSLLRDTVGVPLFVAKPAADFLILGLAQPFALRWLVFRRVA